ncbi:MAG: nitrogenase, partial [Chitinivibrionales bacterium]|nr:nitrogenase [Chitinivibrionales bacterium]MBD3358772.1 nitrogenase [Chitinivibrionales bacterium]
MERNAALTEKPAAARNSCRLCAPLGASLVFRGIAGAVPLLHGSQGCATYIRRYLIGHFREPVDIASSSFGESAAIFGGKDNLFCALNNIISQYRPSMIGIATTCLSETIGDDVDGYLFDYSVINRKAPPIVHVSTPSYRGSHTDGFHGAVKAVISSLARPALHKHHIALLGGMLSPADLRHLRAVLSAFDMKHILFPDYSDTLDGPSWDEYHTIPPGGTSPADIHRLGGVRAAIELGAMPNYRGGGGSVLRERFNVPVFEAGIPVGVKETDRFFSILERIAGRKTPEYYVKQRGRLIDSYVDGHKYVFGRRVAVIADEDLLVGLVSFLNEIAMVPVICATGSGKTGRLKEALQSVAPEQAAETVVVEEADYETIQTHVTRLAPDCIVGNSKAYPLARALGVPLIRVGFPVHDRVGAQRLRHVGYEGTQALFDRLV